MTMDQLSLEAVQLANSIRSFTVQSREVETDSEYVRLMAHLKECAMELRSHSATLIDLASVELKS